MRYTKIKSNNYEWFHLSNGEHIIYCEPIKYSSNYKISSVHKPSRDVGTGYQLDDNAQLTAETVTNLLRVIVPNWAHRSDFEKIKKYKDMQEFINYQKQFFDVTTEDINIE